MRIEDRLLVRGFNAGDTRALRRMHEKYTPDLLSVARALLLTPLRKKDHRQDTRPVLGDQGWRTTRLPVSEALA